MDNRIQIVAIIAVGALLLFVLELVRRRRLLERYALLWLFSSAVLLILACWRGGLGWLADRFGIAYPPNALFFVAFGFVLALLLHFSVAVSRHSDQIKVLAQRLALLEERQQRPGSTEQPVAEPVSIGVGGESPAPAGRRAEA